MREALVEMKQTQVRLISVLVVTLIACSIPLGLIIGGLYIAFTFLDVLAIVLGLAMAAAGTAALVGIKVTIKIR